MYRAGHKCPIQAVQALDMDIPPNHSWELSAISGLSTLDPETFGLTEMPFAALGGGVNFGASLSLSIHSYSILLHPRSI